MNYSFYEKEKFHKGDLILIPFGEKIPSVYRVESARGKRLIVTVLQDFYEKSPQKVGRVLDVSKAIYEGYWCFKQIPHVKAKTRPQVQEFKP